MATKARNKRLSALLGGYVSQTGPDLMFQQLEEGYDQEPDNIALICTQQSWGYLRKNLGEQTAAGCLTRT